MRREIDVEDKNLRNNIFIGLVSFFNTNIVVAVVLASSIRSICL